MASIYKLTRIQQVAYIVTIFTAVPLGIIMARKLFGVTSYKCTPTPSEILDYEEPITPTQQLDDNGSTCPDGVSAFLITGICIFGSVGLLSLIFSRLFFEDTF